MDIAAAVVICALAACLAAVVVGFAWALLHYWPRVSKSEVHREAFLNHTAIALAKGDADMIRKLLVKLQQETDALQTEPKAERAMPDREGPAEPAPFVTPQGEVVAKPNDFTALEWEQAKHRAGLLPNFTTIYDVVNEMRAERSVRSAASDGIPAPLGADPL